MNSVVHAPAVPDGGLLTSIRDTSGWNPGIVAARLSTLESFHQPSASNEAKRMMGFFEGAQALVLGLIVGD